MDNLIRKHFQVLQSAFKAVLDLAGHSSVKILFGQHIQKEELPVILMNFQSAEPTELGEKSKGQGSIRHFNYTGSLVAYSQKDPLITWELVSILSNANLQEAFRAKIAQEAQALGISSPFAVGGFGIIQDATEDLEDNRWLYAAAVQFMFNGSIRRNFETNIPCLDADNYSDKKPDINLEINP